MKSGSSSQCKHRALTKDGTIDRRYRCHLRVGHEVRPGGLVLHQAPAGMDTVQWAAKPVAEA